MEFLKSKMAIAKDTGFEISPDSLNQNLLPHQRDIVAWAIRGGRRAIFAKFGLGKTVMEVEFCRKVIDEKRRTGIDYSPSWRKAGIYTGCR